MYQTSVSLSEVTLLATSDIVLVTSAREINRLLLVTTALVNTVIVEETEVDTFSIAIESALDKGTVLFVLVVICMTRCSATSAALFFFCPLVLPCLRCFSC